MLSQKANWLAARKGLEVMILTHSQNGNAPVYSFDERIKFYDLAINYQDGISFFHPSSLAKALKHQMALKVFLKQYKPDVLISCSFGPDFYFLPHIEKKLPKIKEFHSSRFFQFQRASSFKDKFLQKLSSISEKKFDCIVVLNPDEKKFYNSDKIEIIPNPAETASYRAKSTSHKALAAGRISPVKNFEELINAWALIHSKFPNWELHFYGEDYLETEAKLQKQINHLGLTQVVKFKGVTQNLRQTMQDYSIYAMTSETECFPMVLLEALSVGMPVVTYDAPTGPRHIVTNSEDGFVVPYNNLDNFAAKLQTIMSNEDLRRNMGINGIENVKRFSIDKVMKRWLNLFEEVRKY